MLSRTKTIATVAAMALGVAFLASPAAAQYGDYGQYRYSERSPSSSAPYGYPPVDQDYNYDYNYDYDYGPMSPEETRWLLYERRDNRRENW